MCRLGATEGHGARGSCYRHACGSALDLERLYGSGVVVRGTRSSVTGVAVPNVGGTATGVDDTGVNGGGAGNGVAVAPRPPCFYTYRGSVGFWPINNWCRANFQCPTQCRGIGVGSDVRCAVTVFMPPEAAA